MNDLSQLDYLSVLFNEGELACFGTTAYDTTPSKVSIKEGRYISTAQYVTLNPLKGTRADANVASFRNILIEMDKCGLEKQLKILEEKETPHSSLVFSGSKSYHAVISVDGDGFGDRQTYDKYVRAVYEAIDPKEKYIDQACKNPSRFTRLGGAIRPDNGVVQSILSLGRRINKDMLDEWLLAKLGMNRYLYLIAGGAEYERKLDEHARLLASLNEPKNKKHDRWWYVSRRAKDFLTNNNNGNKNYGWRNEAYYACCELARCGYDETEIYNELYKVDGYLESDSETIPAEAFQTISRQGELGCKLESND